MPAAQSEYNACSGRTAGAMDIEQRHFARYGQNDREITIQLSALQMSMLLEGLAWTKAPAKAVKRPAKAA